jgi:hypothetical protein
MRLTRGGRTPTILPTRSLRPAAAAGYTARCRPAFDSGICSLNMLFDVQVVDSKRRDVGVVDRARLESESPEQRQATPTHLIAYALSDLAAQNYQSVCVSIPRYSSRF